MRPPLFTPGVTAALWGAWPFVRIQLIGLQGQSQGTIKDLQLCLRSAKRDIHVSSGAVSEIWRPTQRLGVLGTLGLYFLFSALT